MEKIKRNLKKISLIILLITQLIFIFLSIYSKLFVLKYLILIILVFLILDLLFYKLFKSKHLSKINKYLLITIVILLSLGIVFADIGLYQGINLMSMISQSSNKKKNVVSVIVLKDENIKLKQIKQIGVLKQMDRFNSEKLLKEINENKKLTFEEMENDNIEHLVKSLYSKEVDAIILNESYRSTAEETFTDFDSKTKVIYTYEYEEEIEDLRKNVSVTKEPFNVFVSGMDVYGDISQVSRSDVNMIVTIDPINKKILMTNIPRDYYVGISCNNWVPDKLTHAGAEGISCSVGTVEKIFDLDINYYLKVNFSSIMDIVDTLGGVEVWSDYAFQVKEFKYKKGWQWMSGTRALWFARERYSFPGGDHQRIKNHQYLLDGIIRKITSPAVIVNYSDLLNDISDNFVTNMSKDEISSLIAMQLDDMAEWEISSQTLAGENGSAWSPWDSTKPLSVVFPDETSIKKAKKEIVKRLDMKKE